MDIYTLMIVRVLFYVLGFHIMCDQNRTYPPHDEIKALGVPTMHIIISEEDNQDTICWPYMQYQDEKGEIYGRKWAN